VPPWVTLHPKSTHPRFVQISGFVVLTNSATSVGHNCATVFDLETIVLRAVKLAGKRLLRVLFELGQRFGVDLLPRHFYSEIPDIRLLKATREWRRPFSMYGIDNPCVEDQADAIESWMTDSVRQALAALRPHEVAIQLQGEDGYGPIEADALYAFILKFKPSTVFQIGCGVSTAVILIAAEHAAYQPKVICVEPYPSQYLRKLSSTGAIELWEQDASTLATTTVESLGENVFFFVDSSHTLGPAGEVSRIILEMIPRLARGSYVHFHDVYFPHDYSPDILGGALFFSHETALLYALLLSNRYRLLVSMSMLHKKSPNKLSALFPRYRPAVLADGVLLAPGHFPSSLYFRVVA
jgi:hypothetical protein